MAAAAPLGTKAFEVRHFVRQNPLLLCPAEFLFNAIP